MKDEESGLQSLEVTQKMIEEFTALNRMIRENRDREMESLGLTGRQTDVLFFLLQRRDEKINQVMIEREFGLSNPTVTGILNRLEQHGFIVRVKAAEDKRCRYITITEKAECLDAQIREKRKMITRRILDGISPEEMEVFQRTLDLMLRNLRNETEKCQKTGRASGEELSDPALIGTVNHFKKE